MKKLGPNEKRCPACLKPFKIKKQDDKTCSISCRKELEEIRNILRERNGYEPSDMEVDKAALHATVSDILNVLSGKYDKNKPKSPKKYRVGNKTTRELINERGRNLPFVKEEKVSLFSN